MVPPGISFFSGERSSLPRILLANVPTHFVKRARFKHATGRNCTARLRIVLALSQVDAQVIAKLSRVSDAEMKDIE
jgi:hypothetical protein